MMWIFGCGDIGQRLACAYGEAGRSVTGLVRRPERQAALEALGIPALARDLDQAPLEDLALADREIFYLAPPPGTGVEETRIRRLVAAFACTGSPRRLVYISTTGVYGDCAGAWVDETWPAAPVAARARRRWDAEQTLRAWSRDTGAELILLRVAGIYGPGRLPLERLRRGLPVLREADSPYSNRVHAEDVTAACLAAMERGTPGRIYHVADGHPTTMTDYFLRLADAAGLPRPPVIGLEEAQERFSEEMLSYLRESRRLSNRRLREELGVRLRFPRLEDGLAALFPSAAGPLS